MWLTASYMWLSILRLVNPFYRFSLLELDATKHASCAGLLGHGRHAYMTSKLERALNAEKYSHCFRATNAWESFIELL